ncbi:MAG: PIN domain-containing protein [Actinobacteria bacterium]|nr:PIN domain-containing protein [Actinomycetota bacterium]
MIAIDSSVAIAAFATWSEHHAAAIDLLNAESGILLPGHAALETYSVLTRLPAPHRAKAELVDAFINSWFPGPLPQLDARAHAALRSSLVALRITGGAVHDALIAATARDLGATLVTLDRRATATYERIGVGVRVLA